MRGISYDENYAMEHPNHGDVGSVNGHLIYYYLWDISHTVSAIHAAVSIHAW